MAAPPHRSTQQGDCDYMSTSIDLSKRSIEVILQNQAPSGAYVASPTFRVYNYSWFRDGAFIAEAAFQNGNSHSALKFHHWAAEVVCDRHNQIDELLRRHRALETINPDDHLHCRYHLDGSTASEDWTNFQLDGFGTWLWTLSRHFPKSAPENVVRATELLIPYLAAFWASPSFDWWEEAMGHVHISSIGCIAVGLREISSAAWLNAALANEARAVADLITEVIAERGIIDGRLRKWVGGAGVDASLLALIEPLQLFPPESEIAKRTVAAVRDTLATPGVHRHADDTYFGGGEWLLLTAFLGLCEIGQGDFAHAQIRLKWIEEQQTENGDLPEQVANNLLHPEFEQQWIDRWGPSASPLLWSHAMYLLLKKACDVATGAARP